MKKSTSPIGYWISYQDSLREARDELPNLRSDAAKGWFVAGPIVIAESSKNGRKEYCVCDHISFEAEMRTLGWTFHEAHNL